MTKAAYCPSPKRPTWISKMVHSMAKNGPHNYYP